MKEIKYYRTYSYTGVEDRDLEKRDFETIEHAKVDAINDESNINFRLYEITMIFDGIIKETQKFLGPITCGREIKNFETKESSRKR